MTTSIQEALDRHNSKRLEINAEAIERQLNAVWQSLSAEKEGEESLVRICLSNILIVTDTTGQAEAVELAAQLTALQPSRLFLIVIDESCSSQSGFVRTACNFSATADSAVCWEIIELRCPPDFTDSLPGAIRSLLVGAVPVITVDFRQYQQSPLFDATILRLSDYYFVNAEIVPTGELQRRFIPLRWYRTLPVRELLGSLFGRIVAEQPYRRLTRIKINVGQSRDRIDVLIAGWIIHRLVGTGRCESDDTGLLILWNGRSVRITRDEESSHSGQLLQLEFDNGSTVSISDVSSADNMEPEYSAEIDGLTLTERLADYPIGEYIIEATRQPAEFDEYNATRKVVMETKFI